MAMFVTLSDVPPVLVSVTFCAVLATCRRLLLKLRLLDDRPTLGPELTPVPVSVASAGETVELAVTFTVAVKFPVPAGVNVKLMLQEPPAATLVQLFVWEKSAAF